MEARRAHNPEVPRSKLGVARNFLTFCNEIYGASEYQQVIIVYSYSSRNKISGAKFICFYHSLPSGKGSGHIGPFERAVGLLWDRMLGGICLN